MNDVHLSGKVDRAQYRTVGADNIPLLTWTTVVERSFKGRDGQTKVSTQYIKCCAWRKVAEDNQRLRDGLLVTCRGSINNRSYQKDDGSTAYITEVVCTDVNMENHDNDTVAYNPAADYGDDLPF
jgi:single-strand DNA-binding protein